MVPYAPPLEEMRFVLEETAGLAGIAALPGCEAAASDVVAAVLEHAAEFAGGFRQIHCHRHRTVGQGRQIRQPQAGMNGEDEFIPQFGAKRAAPQLAAALKSKRLAIDQPT